MIPLVFITILIFYIGFISFKNLYNSKIFIEPFQSDISVINLKNLYNKRIDEMKDPNNVLKRPIINNNNNILPNVLPLVNQKYILADTYQTNISKQQNRAKLLEQIKTNCILKDKELFINEEQFYYYDSRYPEQLIPIEFALNPIEFIKNNPKLYPSYKINNNQFCNNTKCKVVNTGPIN